MPRGHALAYADSVQQRVDRDTPHESEHWDAVKRMCSDWNNAAVQFLFHRYDPDLYVDRMAIHELITDFLKSDKRLMIITGDAGKGKTNLLCHLSQVLDLPSLLINMDRYHTLGITFPECVDEIVASFKSPEATSLDGLLRLAENAAESFVLLIDAINECNGCHILFESLLRFLEKNFTRERRLKICLTCRTESLKWLLEGDPLLGYTQVGPLPEGYTYFSQITQTEYFHTLTYNNIPTLGNFTEGERDLAIEKERTKNQHLRDYNFDDPGIRALCSFPLLKKIIMRLPKTSIDTIRPTTDLEVFKELWNTKLGISPSRLSTFVIAFVDYLINLTLLCNAKWMESQKPIDAIKKPPPFYFRLVREDNIPGIEVFYRVEVLQKLIDMGLFIRMRDGDHFHIGFFHELFFEYSFAKRMLLLDDTDVIVKIVEFCLHGLHFNVLKFFLNETNGAQRVDIFRHLSQKDGGRLWRASFLFSMIMDASQEERDFFSSDLEIDLERDRPRCLSRLLSMARCLPNETIDFVENNIDRLWEWGRCSPKNTDWFEEWQTEMAKDEIQEIIIRCIAHQEKSERKVTIARLRKWVKSANILLGSAAARVLIAMADYCSGSEPQRTFKSIPDRSVDIIFEKARQIHVIYGSSPQLFFARFRKYHSIEDRYIDEALTASLRTMHDDRPDAYLRLKKTRSGTVRAAINTCEMRCTSCVRQAVKLS
jgi:hypothetical protein